MRGSLSELLVFIAPSRDALAAQARCPNRSGERIGKRLGELRMTDELLYVCEVLHSIGVGCIYSHTTTASARQRGTTAAARQRAGVIPILLTSAEDARISQRRRTLHR